MNIATASAPQEPRAGADAPLARANSRHRRSPSPPGQPAAHAITRCAAFFCRQTYAPRLRIFSLALVCALELAISPAALAGGVTLQVGDIQGEGWSAQGVSVQWTQTEDGKATARIEAARLSLPDVQQTLEQVVVTCARPSIQPPRFGCPDARITGRFGTTGKQTLRAQVLYDAARGTLDFDVKQVKLAGGTAGMKGQWRQSGWQAQVEARTVQLGALRKLAAPWFELPKDYSLDGVASVNASARGRVALEDATAHIAIDALTANNTAGTVATDKLALQVDAHVRPIAQDWLVDATIGSSAGQAYSDPIFVDLAANPVQAALQGRWKTIDGALRIERLQLNQPGVMQMALAGEVGFSQPPFARELQIDLQRLEFPGAYAALMQPFLLDTDFKELVTSGHITGRVTVQADAPTALELDLHDVTANDKGGKLGLAGLSGKLVWSSQEQPSETPSHLAWTSANAYGLSGGSAQLDFIASGKDLRLLQPALIPILDGGLFVRTLNVQAAGTDDMSLRFEGELRPIGMAPLSKAFGWPEFPGTLAGKIPQVSYDKGTLSVGGVLEARAFDGTVSVAGLELRDALGAYPRLKADITVRNLDLEALTGTFSFGMITGRLDGEFRNLELFRWTPVRMDARLYTPKGDKSRHLISQRAVKNLSSIGGGGGGVAAALQSGFLRFFENFRYRILGLSCRLENDVCQMDGVERAAGDSYYLVKGSGIPRIDIIGNSRRVDWPTLVEQLKAATESEGPVVQ